MAKFLPFVNKDTPIHEIADKICSRYSGCNLATKLQFLNIIVSEGLEKVENAVKGLHEGSTKIELVVIREFSHVTPIPSKTLLLISYFLEFLKMICPGQNTCSREFNDMVSDEAKEILITLLVFKNLDTYIYIGYGLPPALTAAHYRKSLSERKLFNSSSSHIRVFTNAEELEAYLLLAYLDPVLMFGTVGPQKGFIFTTPVKAVFRGGYSS